MDIAGMLVASSVLLDAPRRFGGARAGQSWAVSQHAEAAPVGELREPIPPDVVQRVATFQESSSDRLVVGGDMLRNSLLTDADLEVLILHPEMMQIGGSFEPTGPETVAFVVGGIALVTLAVLAAI